jgi:bacterioferritin (cytochrome b1)
MLNRALAMTRAMALRCEREYHTALRLHSPPLAGAALEHANDAGGHAHRIRERMRELGGEINQAAEIALPSQRTAREADNPLAAVIADDLSAARAALDGYREIAAFFAPFDPPTCQLLDQIIQGENERADDLAGLLDLASARTAH